jgi:hypothetical protein
MDVRGSTCSASAYWQAEGGAPQEVTKNRECALCSPSLPSVNAFAGPVATSLLSFGWERILKGLMAQGTGGVKE